MSPKLLISFVLCALLPLAGCMAESHTNFEECYAEETKSRTEETVAHLEHCDAETSLIHASKAACEQAHAGHMIKADVLAAHCNAIL